VENRQKPTKLEIVVRVSVSFWRNVWLDCLQGAVSLGSCGFESHLRQFFSGFLLFLDLSDAADGSLVKPTKVESGGRLSKQHYRGTPKRKEWVL